MQLGSAEKSHGPFVSFEPNFSEKLREQIELVNGWELAPSRNELPRGNAE
jgi:hypothetical protein